MEIIGIITFLALIVIIFYLYKIEKSSLSNKITYLGNIGRIGPNEELTTCIPIPAQAAICDHDWEPITDRLIEMTHEKKYVLVLECKRCGMLDKTIQITSPVPVKVPEPCSHDWNVTVEQSLEMPHEKKVVAILTCKKCGSIDKTVETTSKAPIPAIRRDECRHQWDIEKKVTLESAYEQTVKKSAPKIPLDMNKSPAWIFQKTCISVRTCRLCGEIDKIIASNFEPPTEDEE